MTYSRKILKRMEAHGGNEPMWFAHHDDYPNWENGNILHLMDCNEIWELHYCLIWNKEDMAHTTGLYYFRKHINHYCDYPTSIWHMQIGIEATDDYSQIFCCEKQALDSIKNNQIVWSKGDPTWDI